MLKEDTHNLRQKLVKELVSGMLESIQRKNVDFSAAPENALPEKREGEYDVKENLNIPYINFSEIPLAMDVFEPETGEDTPHPVIVVIHGGGLVIGDRKLSRNYSRTLARKGYLVFSVEYRLIPRVTVAEAVEDVIAGLQYVAEYMENYNVDMNRVYMTCESAGAFLALYSLVATNTESMQSVSGFKFSRIPFKGIGLFSGMLYTRLYDALGVFFNEQYNACQDKYPRIKEFADPENPEVLGKLPPVFLVTSNGDFLNRYTLMFHKALKDAGKPVKLKYYGSSSLGHAFVTMKPGLPESQDAIDCMLNWFESQLTNGQNEK